MNIALILSGGIGQRFGSDLPKQYQNLNGKPVIDYVIQAALDCKSVDQIVIVCDPSYQAYTPLTKQIEVAYVSQGKTRNGSVKNGLDFIAANYDCQRVCILDAVRPFVSSQIIEEYLSRLADYEAVVTCQKITGELGNYHHDVLDRNDYYLTESPEAFRFDTLYQNFSLDKPSTEVVNHLPTTCSRYLNFDFSFNPKITYYFDLEYAANMLKKNSASK